jgi:hypothetical protein
MEQNFNDEERYRRAQKRVKDIKGFYWHLFWYLAVNIFLTFGSSIKGVFVDGTFNVENFNFGAFSVWFFWGIGLAGHWLQVFGTNFIFSKDWENRKIKEFMDKDSLH